VSDTRAGQFEVVLSDGLRIERLPAGIGAGLVWVTFVFSGIKFFAGTQLPDGRFHWEKRQFFTFDGPTGPARYIGGGGGGGHKVQHKQYEFEAKDLPWLRVTYLEDGSPIGTETIDLS
jgi:hypothetical protein